MLGALVCVLHWLIASRRAAKREAARRLLPRWIVTFAISSGARHEILLDDTPLSRLAVLSAALRPNGIERVNQ